MVSLSGEEYPLSGEVVPESGEVVPLSGEEYAVNIHPLEGAPLASTTK